MINAQYLILTLFIASSDLQLAVTYFQTARYFVIASCCCCCFDYSYFGPSLQSVKTSWRSSAKLFASGLDTKYCQFCSSHPLVVHLGCWTKFPWFVPLTSVSSGYPWTNVQVFMSFAIRNKETMREIPLQYLDLLFKGPGHWTLEFPNYY